MTSSGQGNTFTTFVVKWGFTVGAIVLNALGFGIAVWTDALVNFVSEKTSQQIAALIFALVFLLVIVSAHIIDLKRAKKTPLDRSEPVKGKGYCIDKQNGEPLCPRCAHDGVATYLSDQGSVLYCFVCNCGLNK